MSNWMKEWEGELQRKTTKNRSSQHKHTPLQDPTDQDVRVSTQSIFFERE